MIPSVSANGAATPVAFADVDFNARRVDANLKRYPGVKQFADFRVMLEKMGKDIDAVTVVTPDHTHFPRPCWRCPWANTCTWKNP